MAQQPQSLANHARFEPLFHFVCFGLLVAFLVHSIFRVLHHPGADTIMFALLGIALLLLAWYARVFALTVQDRVIRLEMALRVNRVAPELAPRFGELTRAQFVALRFAGDAELPGLMREVLEGKLTRAIEIKRRVRDWQADDLRA